MFTGLRHFRRILSVVRTLARHDALFPLERAGLPRAAPFLIRLFLFAKRNSGAASRRPGERITAALTDLGPAFVKLGQALSVRPDIVGDALAEDLRSLQDQLPPFDGHLARQARAFQREQGVMPGERARDRQDPAKMAQAVKHGSDSPGGMLPDDSARQRRDIDISEAGIRHLGRECFGVRESSNALCQIPVRVTVPGNPLAQPG